MPYYFKRRWAAIPFLLFVMMPFYLLVGLAKLVGEKLEPLIYWILEPSDD